MLRVSISDDPATGTSLLQPNPIAASYLELLIGALDLDAKLTAGRTVLRVRPPRRFTKRQRERLAARHAYLAERDRAAVAHEEQIEAEERATEAYLQRIQQAMRAAAEREMDEIEKEAKLLAREIAGLERIRNRVLRGGKGFRTP